MKHLAESQRAAIERAAQILQTQGYDAFVAFMSANLRRSAASALGSIKSERKAVSSANNGKLGGRPRKPR